MLAVHECSQAGVCFTSTKQGRGERESRTSRMANKQRKDGVRFGQHNRCTECTNLEGTNLEGYSVLCVNEAEERGEGREGHSL